MKFYIEGVVVLIIFFTFFLWFIWKKISERRLLKKYKPENDKGRKGDKFGTAEQGAGRTSGYSDGPKQPERRQLLQETEVNHDGETDDSNGQSNKSDRGTRFFRRE